MDFSVRIAAPQRSEHITLTVSADLIRVKLGNLSGSESLLETRNRLLMMTLLESGGTVAEVARLRFDQIHAGGQIEFIGKSARIVPIPIELARDLIAFRSQARGCAYVFQGFKRTFALGNPITSRGIQLLLEEYSGHWQVPGVVPRTLRHAIVLDWHSRGIEQGEIQRRLGLRTSYAFRVYSVLFRRVEGPKGLKRKKSKEEQRS